MFHPVHPFGFYGFRNIASNVINNMMLPPLLMHNISDFDDAPYLTPTATKLMRNISDGKRVPLEEDVEESQIDYAGL
jgi:hypothetical protein